jgi:mono/diheme cytochrome c family protein
MSRHDILRAWKNASRKSTQVSDNPAGAVELSAAEAATVEGKLAYAICSGCHGCTRVGNFYSAVINPAPFINPVRLKY